VVFRENHVFITKRPLADKHVSLEVRRCALRRPGRHHPSTSTRTWLPHASLPDPLERSLAHRLVTPPLPRTIPTHACRYAMPHVLPSPTLHTRPLLPALCSPPLHCSNAPLLTRIHCSRAPGQVMLCGDGLPGGKTLASGRWSVVELLQASPPPPTSWTGVHQVRRARGRRDGSQGARGEG
jgi:hypothetical protein